MTTHSDRLLAWYDRHARVLPWRVSPEDRAVGVIPDPYKVWMSEIMLQQTTVAAVISYFQTFTKVWPTVADLAAADREDILKEWAGLGYYSRARNLKACADKVMIDFNGRFPETQAELKSLPGIGDYTSAAIAAIAFDEPATVVDGNVERVVTRLFAIDEPLPGAKPSIKAKATELTPQKRPGDYAQAMMDLGATICSPKRPACALCPLRENCISVKTGRQEDFPVKAPKKEKPIRYGSAFVAEREDGSILLRTREDKGLLGGMTEVPGSEWQVGSMPLNAMQCTPIDGKWEIRCGSIRHTFTHFHLEVDVFKHQFSKAQTPPDHHWWSEREAIPSEALPTVMKKIIECACPGSTKRKK